MRTAWILFLLLAACTLTELATTALPLEGKLALAWEQDGNLFVWQSGASTPRQIATEGVVQAFIALDGAQIAFTRGANRAPETLWIIGIDGSGERQLAGENPAEYQPGAMQIGDVRWLDGETLYFNTLSQAEPAFIPNHDLYAIDTRTDTITQVLPSGAGGRIHISPDHQHILLVNPGRYGESEGRIRLYNPQTGESPRDLLTYPAVASASEFPFYHAIDWLPDSSAALVAIPDADAVYSERSSQPAPPVRLWRLPLAEDEQAQTIGTLQASIFGLPRWSENASQMLFLRWDESATEVSLVLADGTGADEQVYLRDVAQLIAYTPRWIPETPRFFYVEVQPSSESVYYLGSADEEPLRINTENMLLMQFINADYFLALFPENANRWSLRLIRLEDGSAQTIAHFPAESIPLLSVQWQPEG